MSFCSLQFAEPNENQPLQYASSLFLLNWILPSLSHKHVIIISTCLPLFMSFTLDKFPFPLSN